MRCGGSVKRTTGKSQGQARLTALHARQSVIALWRHGSNGALNALVKYGQRPETIHRELDVIQVGVLTQRMLPRIICERSQSAPVRNGSTSASVCPTARYCFSCRRCRCKTGNSPSKLSTVRRMLRHEVPRPAIPPYAARHSQTANDGTGSSSQPQIPTSRPDRSITFHTKPHPLAIVTCANAGSFPQSANQETTNVEPQFRFPVIRVML